VSAYDWAWVVIGAAALLGWLALMRLTRPLGGSPVRWLLQGLVLLWFVLPAPVPGHPGQWAPAFVVLVFESIFQSGGQPVPAALILLTGSLVTVALVLWLALRRGRHAAGEVERPAAAAEEADGDAPAPSHARKVVDPN